MNLFFLKKKNITIGEKTTHQRNKEEEITEEEC